MTRLSLTSMTKESLAAAFSPARTRAEEAGALVGRTKQGAERSGEVVRDDLADLAIDELTELTGQTADEAKALIMKAREHWFADQE